MLLLGILLLLDEGNNAFLVVQGNIRNLANILGNLTQVLLVLFDFFGVQECNIDTLLATGLGFLLSAFGNCFLEAIEHLKINIRI